MEYRWNIDGLSKDYRRIIEELSKNYRRNAIYKHKITCFALDEWTGTDYQTIPAKKSKFTKIIVRLLRIKTKKQSCVLSIYWTSYMCYTLSLAWYISTIHYTTTYKKPTPDFFKNRIFQEIHFRWSQIYQKYLKMIRFLSERASFQTSFLSKELLFKPSFLSNRAFYQNELFLSFFLSKKTCCFIVKIVIIMPHQCRLPRCFDYYFHSSLHTNVFFHSACWFSLFYLYKILQSNCSFLCNTSRNKNKSVFENNQFYKKHFCKINIKLFWIWKFIVLSNF